MQATCIHRKHEMAEKKKSKKKLPKGFVPFGKKKPKK